MQQFLNVSVCPGAGDANKKYADLSKNKASSKFCDLHE